MGRGLQSTLLAALLVATLLSPGLHPPGGRTAAAQQTITQSQVDQLIDQLGADSAEERSAAARTLFEKANESLENYLLILRRLVEKGLGSDVLEIREGSASLIGRLGATYKCYGIQGRDPPDVVTLMTQFTTETGVEVQAGGQVCAPAVTKDPPNSEKDLEALEEKSPFLTCHEILGENRADAPKPEDGVLAGDRSRARTRRPPVRALAPHPRAAAATGGGATGRAPVQVLRDRRRAAGPDGAANPGPGG